MAKNMEDFFDIINEKTWRNNIASEADRIFEKFIESLQENRQEIIDEVVNDIKRIESIKTEENEHFEYSTFKKWLNKYVRENMQDCLDDD